MNFSTIILFWRNASFWKKTAAVAAVVLAIVVALFVFSMFNSARSSGTSYYSNSVPRGGATSENMEMGLGAASSFFDTSDVLQYTPDAVSYEEKEYEQRSYVASVRTMHQEKVCEDAYTFADHRNVMLQSSYTDRYGCRYEYMVTLGHIETFLEEIQALHPYSLVRFTDSGRKQVLQYTGERDILLQKQQILEQLLLETETAYGDVLAQARNSGDIATMNSAIDGKLQHLETLTQRRISLAQSLARLNRSLSETEERIAFVSVSLQVEGVQVVDGASVASKWIHAWSNLVDTVVLVLIGVTLGLVRWVFVLFQYALYFFVLAIGARLVWIVLRKTVLRSSNIKKLAQKK